MRRSCWIVLVVFLGGSLSVSAMDVPFRRGDTNDDSIVDISDGIFVLNTLFVAETVVTCRDSLGH